MKLKQQTKNGAATCSLIFFAMTCGAAWFGYQGDYAAAAAVIAVAFGGLTGFYYGLLQSMASVGGFALAAVAAPWFGRILDPHLSKLAGTSGLANRALSIGAAGLAMIIAVSIAVSLVSSILFKDRESMADWNHWGGFLCGGFQSAVAVLLLLGGLFVIEPMQRSRGELGNLSPVTRGVLAAVDHTRTSCLGPLVEKYNPFTMFPQLNKVEQIQSSMQTLSDPRSVDRILQHPEIAQLRKDPEFEQALVTLKRDKVISRILHSGEPMSQEKIIAVINSDAVLNLIDQPGFLEKVSTVMGKVQPELNR